MNVLSVVSVTLNKKRLKSLWWMEKKCFPFIVVFYIEHISVQLVLMNVYSYDGFCVEFENKIPFWEEQMYQCCVPSTIRARLPPDVVSSDHISLLTQESLVLTCNLIPVKCVDRLHVSTQCKWCVWLNSGACTLKYSCYMDVEVLLWLKGALNMTK